MHARSPIKKKYHTERYYQYSIYVGKTFVSKVKAKKNQRFGSEFKEDSEGTAEKCFFYKNYYLCPVLDNSIIRFSGMVYNFSVEEDESYLVNNIAVHNCIANVTQCSACGKLVRESDENCEHLDRMLGKYIEIDGKKYIVSELVGAMDANGNYIEDSCLYIESSWVEQPAFEGAVRNFFIECPNLKTNLVMSGEADKRLAMLFEDERSFSKLKVADKRSLISIRLAIQQMRMERYNNITNKIVRAMSTTPPEVGGL